MSTLSLSTVGSSWRQSGVTLTADGLLTVVLRGKGLQGWFNHLVVSVKENSKKSRNPKFSLRGFARACAGRGDTK